MRDVLLIGGGHAHLHVLKSFGGKPMPGVRITLLSRDRSTPYSGMLPGYIAGHYTLKQCVIDLARLADFADAEFVHDECIGLDLMRRRVMRRDGPPIAYDLVSIDIGSTPDLSSVRGAEGRAIPLKPIDRLAERWIEILERARSAQGKWRFVTVGGGASGVEVTLAIQHRLRRVFASAGRDPSALDFTLMAKGGVLETYNRRVRVKLRRILAARGIRIIEGAIVTAVGAGEITCDGGTRIPVDELIWATEAGAAPWLAKSGLALDPGGFIAVDATLRSVSDPHVFASGDVAANIEHPRPKAGVFAVRQGPPLVANIRRAIAGESLEPFVPQAAGLSLISTGDRYAVASRGRWAAEGHWIWWLKDRIDRRWVRQYQLTPVKKP